MSEEKIVKSSKFVKIINSFEDDNINMNEEKNDNDIQNAYDDMQDYDDLLKSFDNVQNDMLSYVIKNDLKLCEFMTFDKLKSFVEKEFL
jgi:hypothetical protein